MSTADAAAIPVTDRPRAACDGCGAFRSEEFEPGWICKRDNGVTWFFCGECLGKLPPAEAAFLRRPRTPIPKAARFHAAPPTTRLLRVIAHREFACERCGRGVKRGEAHRLILTFGAGERREERTCGACGNGEEGA